MSLPQLADQAHRDKALDVSQSFSVQAPAGSGKTELLTLRYLNLLAGCEQPEEALAITFTRKAASEMRARIITSLTWAADLNNQENPHFETDIDARRFEIASKVLARDKALQWHVLNHPARLRVQTIDSFCYYLASQLPVLSRLGGRIAVSEEVEHIFVDAVRTTLDELNGSSEISDDIALLHQQYDNDSDKIERLLTQLLFSRDQWLSHVLGIRSGKLMDQDYLRDNLAELINESLDQATAGLLPLETELLELFNFAASNLPVDKRAAGADFEPLAALPASDSSAMPYWRSLTEMLLTAKNEWRKKLNINNGFPAGDKQDKAFDAECKSRKKQVTELLEALRDDNELLETLVYVSRLPDPAVEEPQWLFLSAIARILAFLNAQLLLSFRKFNCIDHVQTGAAARDALIDSDAPTDLALSLDHRIQHILVDEFQDTSQLQVDILEQLVAGWQSGDGRTLFVVGDAMQSCYGFRNANVGLFLKVRESGLGGIQLQALTLTSNFRSQAGLVDWVNTIFASAFPHQVNSSRGAVPFTPSVASKDALPQPAVTSEFLVFEDGQRDAALNEEARRVLDRVVQLRKNQAQESIAILVRNRSHLLRITSALREAGIQWQSTDIDRLVSLTSIRDLLNLTRALLNPSDRVAWLGLLRAPWCGLNIADLFAIESFAGSHSIWFALQQLDAIEDISEDARGRLQDVVEVLRFAIARSYRISLRQLLESTWTLLRGACTLTEINDAASIAHFFQLLDEHGVAGGLADLNEFEAKVAKAFVPSKTDIESSDSVHIMTMHKAKGLEFDHVILPGLAHKTQTNDKALLQWHERLNQQGFSKLFIATLSAAGEDDDPLYSLLRYERQYKASLETTRLLYIAATRARQTVHLCATLRVNSHGDAEPANGSLLQPIWNQLQAHGGIELQALSVETTETQAEHLSNQTGIRYPSITPIMRFDQPLLLEASENRMLARTLSREETATAAVELEIETATVDELAARVGTFIHRALESSVNLGESLLADKSRLANLKAFWRRQLQTLTADEDALNAALDFIENSICRSLNSEPDGWIFNADLQDSSTELAISARTSAGVREFVVDRSFVDAENNRWIIDYKTAPRLDLQSEDEFINEQIHQHREQLDKYKTLFEKMDRRPIRTALFLTGIGRLVELLD